MHIPNVLTLSPCPPVTSPAKKQITAMFWVMAPRYYSQKTGHPHSEILNKWAKTHLSSPQSNFFQPSITEVSSVHLKNAQIKQSGNGYRMPLPALWHRLSFDHAATVPRSLHWKPVKCYIHFKGLLLVSKVLNAKLESLSNLLLALCSELQAWDHNQWVIGLPHFVWGHKPHSFLLVCVLAATWSV